MFLSLFDLWKLDMSAVAKTNFKAHQTFSVLQLGFRHYAFDVGAHCVSTQATASEQTNLATESVEAATLVLR